MIINITRNIIKVIILTIVSLSFNVLVSAQIPTAGQPGLQDSLLTDRDGNHYPIKKMADNKIWMTTNLKLTIPDSYCYENMPSNGERYGRLYSFEAAQKGCALLGEGWHLPSIGEWRQLISHYIELPEDSAAGRKKAYETLLYGGNSALNALLGGGRHPDGQYVRLDAHGFYWTATSTDSSLAWFCNFGKGSQSLYLQNDGDKPGAFSVRCTRDPIMVKK